MIRAFHGTAAGRFEGRLRLHCPRVHLGRWLAVLILCSRLSVSAGYYNPTANQVVAMDDANPMTLGWPARAGATGYDLYFGTNSNAVNTASTNTPVVYQGRTNTLASQVGTLTPATTYYWRVDSLFADGTLLQGSVLAFTTGAAMVDLMADTWVATDGLGRPLPGAADCGPSRSSRPIGIFYLLWHDTFAYGSGTNWDVTRWLAGHPYTNPSNPWADNPIFNQVAEGTMFYWAEPEFGYYHPSDPWVLRRHIAMLTQAGVDVLILDNSNARTYDSEVTALCDTIRQMRNEGFQTNLKFVFLTRANSPATITHDYNTLYAPGRYSELWFYWQGKPLILGYPSGVDNNETPVTATISNFFTWRQSWAWEGGYDKMAWIDSTTPQRFGYHDASDHPESAPVTCGGWATANIGRSYTNRAQPAYDSQHLSAARTEAKGLFFAEQMNYGVKLDPDLLFITGWNEWVTGAWKSDTAGAVSLLGQPCPSNGFYFVDQYTAQYSRDIEPMRGGHADAYYFQMTAQNRLRKGVRATPAASAPQSINLGGDFSDWTNVTTTFFDAANDTVWRNFPSAVAQNGSYSNLTGRNDFTVLKVARDVSYLYFLAQCNSNITAPAGSNWMVLFLDTDQNHATGWEGYDYAVNLGSVGTTTTTLSRNTTTTNGWSWTTTVSSIPYKVSGNQLMFRIARADLGLGGDPISFDFHWADNFQVAGDISDFGINGDSAPDRRFNYRYQTTGQTQVTLASDDFESGKQAAWSGAWAAGSRWELVNTTFYSSSHSAECNLSHGSGNGALQMPLDPSGCSSLRVSFRYKLHGVNNATGVTVSYLGKDVWLYFADVRYNTGTNAQFFTNGFIFKIDGAPLNKSSQFIWIDDFQVTVLPAASVVVKANNTTSLSYGQSWVGNLSPTTNNTARWDSTVTTPNSTLLGADTGWNGLQVFNPGGPVAINGTNILTLGAGGIDLSIASQDLTLNHNISLGSTQSWNVTNSRTLTVNGAVTGTGDLNKDGLGTLVLGGIDTFTGRLNLNGGLLALTNGSAVPDASTVTLADTAGTLLRLDTSETIGALAGGGSLGGWVNLATNSLTLGSNNISTTFSGQISGTGSVIKNGSGTLVLTASNNFAGPWQINGGIVRIQDSAALGQGGFSGLTWTLVGSNAAVELNGNLNLSEHFHILGQGPDNNGAFRAISGSSSLNQHIALDGNSVVSVSAGAMLTQKFQFYNSVGSCSLTKVGDGTLTVNTYVYPNIVVAGGKFVANGILQGSAMVTNAGTLSGNGRIVGPLTVNSGGTLAPGGGMGSLTVNGAVSLAGICAFEVQKIGGLATNDQLIGGSTLSFGGTLAVTNLGGALAAGDTFKLFSAPGYGGSFTNINLPPLPSGLYWETARLAVDGTIAVLALPSLSSTVSPGFVEIFWPLSYSGWALQGQTNPPTVGLTSNWVDVAGVISNAILIPIAPANGSVFYRLIKAP
ncbi:MAG: autotransporter-associated beta strand repeat-containing protein [Verrucomicrobia bacterium]|nr:autotransporter-associated beta strand repeat-containing protein [Verrucomicrobiota bacterium]